MRASRSSIHLLIDAEVRDLLVLVVRLDETQVMLLDDRQLILAEQGEVVEPGQVLDQLNFGTLSAFALIVSDVDLVFNLMLPVARVFH